VKRDVNRAFGRRFNEWHGRVLRCTSKLLARRHDVEELPTPSSTAPPPQMCAR
jgi:hypothetical protein